MSEELKNKYMQDMQMYEKQLEQQISQRNLAEMNVNRIQGAMAYIRSELLKIEEKEAQMRNHEAKKEE